MGTMEWPHPHSSFLRSGSHLGGGHMGGGLDPVLLSHIALRPGPTLPNTAFSTRDSDQNYCLDTPSSPSAASLFFLVARPAELGGCWGWEWGQWEIAGLGFSLRLTQSLGT